MQPGQGAKGCGTSDCGRGAGGYEILRIFSRRKYKLSEKEDFGDFYGIFPLVQELCK